MRAVAIGLADGEARLALLGMTGVGRHRGWMGRPNLGLPNLQLAREQRQAGWIFSFFLQRYPSQFLLGDLSRAGWDMGRAFLAGAACVFGVYLTAEHAMWVSGSQAFRMTRLG